MQRDTVKMQRDTVINVLLVIAGIVLANRALRCRRTHPIGISSHRNGHEIPHGGGEEAH
jgi:hypothetical protein